MSRAVMECQPQEVQCKFTGRTSPVSVNDPAQLGFVPTPLAAVEYGLQQL
jgi:hypothetical protein